MAGLNSQMGAMRMGRPTPNLNAAAAEFVPRNDFRGAPPPPHRFGPPHPYRHDFPPNPNPNHNHSHNQNQSSHPHQPHPSYPMPPQAYMSQPGPHHNYDPYSQASETPPPPPWSQPPQHNSSPVPPHPGHSHSHNAPAPGPALPAPDPKKMQFYMEIQVGAEQIMTEPDKFEDFAEAIRDRILVEDALTALDVETIAGTLLNMAVQIPHVSYPLAKLCAYLVSEMEGQTGEAAHWSGALAEVWQREHAERSQTHSAAPERLRLFAIFAAELFSNVKAPDGGQDLALGRGVLEECETLMSPHEHQSQTDENLKTLVRILKCCGGELERMKIEGGTEINFSARLSSLIQGLQSRCESSPVSESVKKSVGAVVALREAGWGKRKSGGVNGNDGQGPCGGGGGRVEAAEEVVYGPDGEQLSEEERAFLSEAFGSVTESVLRSSTDEDHDADKAYEEFLKSQKSS